MFFRRNLGKNDLLLKSFCIFAGAIRMESKTYWLRFSVRFLFLSPETWKISTGQRCLN